MATAVPVKEEVKLEEMSSTQYVILAE